MSITLFFLIDICEGALGGPSNSKCKLCSVFRYKPAVTFKLSWPYMVQILVPDAPCLNPTNTSTFLLFLEN